MIKLVCDHTPQHEYSSKKMEESPVRVKKEAEELIPHINGRVV